MIGDEPLNYAQTSIIFKSISVNNAGQPKSNEEIEASYLTSVSKNPITLRKTESLKLDSVQSIR
jgi:hypothetical protein